MWWEVVVPLMLDCHDFRRPLVALILWYCAAASACRIIHSVSDTSYIISGEGCRFHDVLSRMCSASLLKYCGIAERNITKF